MKKFDVVVIGAGINGAASAWALARQGASVCLIEQFQIAHTRGSSHGHSRIFRLSYGNVEYLRMAQAALLGWRELEALSGMQLLKTTGGLDFAAPDNQSLADCIASCKAAGVAHEVLSARDVKQRFTPFNLPNDWIGLWQPDAGVLNATLAVATLVGMAAQAGVTVLAHATVDAITPLADGALLRVTQGGQATQISAAKVVIAGGAWMNQLATPLGCTLPLTVTQEQVAYFAMKNPVRYQAEVFPVFIDHTNQNYGFPIDGAAGMASAIKVASHRSGDITTATTRSGLVDAANIAFLSNWLGTLTEDVAALTPLHAQTCLYTNTPDNDFVMGALPQHPTIFVLSACSGHGFKFGVETGRMMAAQLSLAEKRKAASDVLVNDGTVEQLKQRVADLVKATVE